MFIPAQTGALGQLLLGAVLLEWILEAPWQRGGIDGHPKHSCALGTEQFVGCVSSYHLVWAELSSYFFKCYVVHIPFPVEAELNSLKADLC